MDGALLPNHSGGLGAVFRDSEGQLIRAAGKQVTHWDAGQVEMLAISFIRDCLEQQHLDFDGIVIEGDNVNVLTHVKDRLQRRFWSTRPQDAYTFDFLLQFKQLIVNHVTRNSNSVAHFCAQRAIDFSFCWDEIPPAYPSLIVLLREDKDRIASL